MWLAHCPLCLWSSDSSERLKNVLSDKSLDLLKVVWPRVPNSQGNLNSWHRLGWTVVVPCTFVTQRAAQSLHLTPGIVQEMFLHQHKLWRPENYRVAEGSRLSTKKKTLLWAVEESCTCSVPIAQRCTNCFTQMLQEHPSLTLSCHLYPVTFWKSEEYHLLEKRYVSISAVSVSISPFINFCYVLVLSFTNIFLLHSYSFLILS